jgi:hypothetical protein
VGAMANVLKFLVLDIARLHGQGVMFPFQGVGNNPGPTSVPPKPANPRPRRLEARPIAPRANRTSRKPSTGGWSVIPQSPSISSM